MLKFIEVTGKNEDEAIAKGLAQLGLDRDDVSLEILERGKTGFLGIGSVPAKVKLTYEAPDEAPVVEEKPAPAPAPVVEEKVVPVVATQSVEVEPAQTSTPVVEVVDDDVAQAILRFQSGLFAQMGVEATSQVTRDGDTYQVVRVRIHVDAEGYRARREEALQRLAHKTAAKVVKYRRNITLEAMNAYERHVIHAALQDVAGVSTYSTGTEPNRRTVVAYTPQKR